MKKLTLLFDRLLSIAFWLCILALVWLVLQVTGFTSFRIPTDSMIPTLQPGDRILVNKGIMGGRIFDIFASAEGEEVDINRLPGWRKLKRNDVVVFNNPYARSNAYMSMDLMRYYVKRCIALPGDTLEIVQGHYRIWGLNESVGDVKAQERMERLVSADSVRVMLRSYPWDEHVGWTVQEFGPLAVPAKGQRVRMDSTAVKLYRNLIGWEQKRSLNRKDNQVLLGDSVITEYRFQENYYFVGGDNMENSEDSRYWGLLPEAYIVGVATRIWKSVDPMTDEIRWNRVFKKIE